MNLKSHQKIFRAWTISNKISNECFLQIQWIFLKIIVVFLWTADYEVLNKDQNTLIEKLKKVHLRTSPRYYYFLVTSEIGKPSFLRVLLKIVFEKWETDSYNYNIVGSYFLQIRRSLWTNHYRRKWKKIKSCRKNASVANHFTRTTKNSDYRHITEKSRGTARNHCNLNLKQNYHGLYRGFYTLWLVMTTI